MFSSKPIGPEHRRRVAAYARVSTDKDEQFTSYAAQVEYYRNFIQGHKDWEFVDVYSDEGISGTSRKHREGFNRMISDAMAGKIDLIITKSVSRFARNTVDSLVAIRSLKEKGVECYFEKENIYTFDNGGEILITLMSSLAQEESRSISENIKWAWKHKFEKGEFTLPYSRFLGYDKGEDGKPKVNEQEAEIIRHIYSDFLSGKSPYTIARELENKGIKTPSGNDKWCIHTLQSILSNEKYAGDALLMKTYSTDFLTKTRKRNHGEVKMYDVRESHEAIVSHEIFDLVQEELKTRGMSAGKPYSSGLFAGKIICGDCGTPYGAKVWHSNDKYRRVIYQCNHKFSNGKKCTTPHFTEDEIKAVFVKAANILLSDREEILDNIGSIVSRINNTSELEEQQVRLETAIDVLSSRLRSEISKGPISEQDIASGKYAALNKEYTEDYEKLQKVKTEISRRKNRASELRIFMDNLRNSNAVISEFSEELCVAMLDHMTVNSKTDITVTFRCGTEARITG